VRPSWALLTSARIGILLLSVMKCKIADNGGRQRTATTTAPVAASPVSDAEFCDCAGAFARFGLRRSLLYELHSLGLIKGVSLRRRGAARGKRLWSIDSIRSYLESQMENGGRA
jgi:hypothetical protein